MRSPGAPYSINDDGTIDVEGLYNKDSEGIVDLDEDTMTAKGLLDGYDVVDEVAIFDYDGEAKKADWEDSDNYTVFGYKDLNDAEITGFAVLNDDGDIAAIYTTDGLTSKNTFVAIYGSKDVAYNADDQIWDVELYINGDTKNYDTDKNFEITAKEGQVVVVTLNSDGDITKIGAAVDQEEATPQSDFDNDYVVFKNNGKVDAKDGNKLTVGNYKINIQGASVYKFDGESMDADNYTKSEISVGDNVYVYQFSEDSDTWDVVVIGSPLVTVDAE